MKIVFGMSNFDSLRSAQIFFALSGLSFNQKPICGGELVLVDVRVFGAEKIVASGLQILLFCKVSKSFICMVPFCMY